MGLELLSQADWILNACGRPVPPPGTRFVDLPKFIPFHQGVTSPQTAATMGRVANNNNTLFICTGIMFQTDPVSVRIKWPTGRYLSQNPSPSPAISGACFPQGTGGNLLTLDQEVPIGRGEKIGIEVGAGATGNVDVQFWGKLRYLMKNTPTGAGVINGAPGGGGMQPACIVGYPSAGESRTSCIVGYPDVADLAASGLMLDPIAVYENQPRFDCGSNQNILAPQFRLSNRRNPYAPKGYNDESFTFFSPPIVCPVNSEVIGTAVILPGIEDTIIRRVRLISTWPRGITGVPCFSLRLPNGYSMTGGDLIPSDFLYWCPVFPTLRVPAGERLIIDIGNIQGGGVGSITTVLEFDAAKRMRSN